MSLEFGPYVLGLAPTEGGEPPPRELIGGKAWSVANMIAQGLPVPPAVVVTAEACTHYLRAGEMPAELAAGVRDGVAWLEREAGRSFGGGPSPLLVSVRSGAAISMPGMMDTVLNLGLNDTTEAALAEESADPAFARETRRRFFELFASIVLRGTLPELDATAPVSEWQQQIERYAGGRVPDDVHDQLDAAVAAVFESWNSRRAKRYRKHHDIDDDLGTAVTIQQMVFGNLDDRSGTGVLFSRNPLTGESKPYGEYLARAQGEDVVSGKVTPLALETLREQLPDVHAALLDGAATLERCNRDIQDIEFTVQQDTLYFLQSRAAKRGPAAAVRAAVEMVDEGLIDPDEALSRVSAEQVRTLLSPHLVAGAADSAELLAKGEPACHGVATGVVVMDSDEAERSAQAGDSVILARPTTSPDDVHGMIAAAAVVTDTGGSTSHAAVVGRALGKPSVVGCGAGTSAALKGQEVTVDGTSGRIFAGRLEVESPDERHDPLLSRLLEWSRERAPLRVLAPDEFGDGELLDLDGVKGGEDVAQLPQLVAGASAVSGGAIASREGVEAALAAGVECIVTDQCLPVLLCALEAQRT